MRRTRVGWWPLLVLPWWSGVVAVVAFVMFISAVDHGNAATTIVVTTVADTVAADGACSLREAIQAANTNATVNECVHDGSGGTDTISFNIAGNGPHIINVGVGGLPTITAPVIVDGSLEPSFAGTPVMVLNGAAAGVGAN